MLPSSLGTVLKEILILVSIHSIQTDRHMRQTPSSAEAGNACQGHTQHIDVYMFIHIHRTIPRIDAMLPYITTMNTSHATCRSTLPRLYTPFEQKDYVPNSLVYNSYISFILYQHCIHVDPGLFLDSENEWCSIMRCFNWREKCQKNRIIFVSISMRQ
jgi:hypothetical protein